MHSSIKTQTNSTTKSKLDFTCIFLGTYSFLFPEYSFVRLMGIFSSPSYMLQWLWSWNTSIKQFYHTASNPGFGWWGCLYSIAKTLWRIAYNNWESGPYFSIEQQPNGAAITLTFSGTTRCELPLCNQPLWGSMDLSSYANITWTFAEIKRYNFITETMKWK